MTKTKTGNPSKTQTKPSRERRAYHPMSEEEKAYINKMINVFVIGVEGMIANTENLTTKANAIAIGGMRIYKLIHMLTKKSLTQNDLNILENLRVSERTAHTNFQQFQESVDTGTFQA